MVELEVGFWEFGDLFDVIRSRKADMTQLNKEEKYG
jgi:hypothetical protein